MGGRPGGVATERYTMQRDSLGIEFISLFMERKGKGEEKKREKGEKGRRGKGGRGYLFRRGMERESRLERRQGSPCLDRMREGWWEWVELDS